MSGEAEKTAKEQALKAAKEFKFLKATTPKRRRR